MTTSVASRTGASVGPTTPPETRKPRRSLANRAARSAWPSATLKVPKKRMTGRKSKKNFIVWASARWRREVYRGRVDAEPFAARLGAVWKHMAQMRAAVVAADFDAHRPVRAVHDPLNQLAVDWLRVARPAAAGVELGRRGEERRTAADALVGAFVPVVPVL